MSRRKMIGAHVPQKPKKAHRLRVEDTKTMFKVAFDDWSRRPGKTHLAFRPMPM